MSEIAARVRDYLARTRQAFPPGSDLYYARLALAAAGNAYRTGSFGIGAVAVVRSGTTAEVFYGENGMGRPNAVIDHAETRAVLKIAAGAAPDETIELAGPARSVDVDVAVHGTIEPCPMCACVMTNAGVQRSVSTCADGALERDGAVLASDGAANVLGGKYATQPRVWRDLQRTQGLRFELLTPVDPELRALSWAIMADTRAEIDRALAERSPLGLPGHRPGR